MYVRMCVYIDKFDHLLSCLFPSLFEVFVVRHFLLINCSKFLNFYCISIY